MLWCENQLNSTICQNCKINHFCESQGCNYGNCEVCIKHIQYANNPQFSYPCVISSYFYILRFLYRFASEIDILFKHMVLRNGLLNVVSLGCGPSSEIYGIINGLRNSNHQFTLQYIGYDTNEIWNRAQAETQSLFPQHHIEYRSTDVFIDFKSKDQTLIDIFILNYMLSDFVKSKTPDEKKELLDKIVTLALSHQIRYIICNDIMFCGNANCLNSAFQCMKYIKMKLIENNCKITFYNVHFDFPSYWPDHSETWFRRASNKVSIPINHQSTKVSAWNKCKSDQIVYKISYP